MYSSAGGFKIMKRHAIEADVCPVHAAMVARNRAERDAEAEARKRKRAGR
jgi:hypothetical protein